MVDRCIGGMSTRAIGGDIRENDASSLQSESLSLNAKMPPVEK
jgi:hypothetical protein